VALVKEGSARVDVVTVLSPLQTLEVAQSPSAKVVKNRGHLSTVFGQFNMRKTASPWLDVRLRRAVNLAINRQDLIEYAVKGNGEIIPALIPARWLGRDFGLAPYPFDPARAHDLVREAGYPDGLRIALIAPEDLSVQATVVSKMLEQVGFAVDVQVLDATAYNQRTNLSLLDKPAEQQEWDIALDTEVDWTVFPVFDFYRAAALDGPRVWMAEDPEVRRTYEGILRTLDPDKQRLLVRQIERRLSEQAYFLFLYQPVQLFAVNKDVELLPYVTGYLNLAETSVTGHHWSVRKRTAER
jgi:peptide/nickel transport system substrate-binding protein